jgi:hypothetical protein
MGGMATEIRPVLTCRFFRKRSGSRSDYVGDDVRRLNRPAAMPVLSRTRDNCEIASPHG